MSNLNQPKNETLKNAKSKLMGGVGATLLSLSLAACNVLPNNQKTEPQKITQESSTTQEQIDSRIIFARDYPEAFNMLKGIPYTVEIEKDATKIKFTKDQNDNKTICDVFNFLQKRKDINATLSLPFTFGKSQEEIKANNNGFSINIYKGKGSEDIYHNKPEPKTPEPRPTIKPTETSTL